MELWQAGTAAQLEAGVVSITTAKVLSSASIHLQRDSAGSGNADDVFLESRPHSRLIPLFSEHSSAAAVLEELLSDCYLPRLKLDSQASDRPNQCERCLN